jgi:hypothetical protein
MEVSGDCSCLLNSEDGILLRTEEGNNHDPLLRVEWSIAIHKNGFKKKFLLFY